MFRLGRTFTFDLRTSTILGTDGSGDIMVTIPFNPAATLNSTYLSGAAIFPEWTSLANLFSEVKVSKFQVTFTPAISNDSKTGTIGAIAMASSSAAIVPTPTTYNQVEDNGDSQLWPLGLDNSGTGRYHAVDLKVGTYAGVATPNPGSSTGISAGCPGAIIIFANTLPASAQVGYIRIVGRYIFRGRV